MRTTSDVELNVRLDELFDHSRRLMEDVEGLSGEMQDYYRQLLDAGDETAVTEEVKQKVTLLERSGEALRRASSQTYSMSDELLARWKDVLRSRRKLHLLAPPPNAAIDAEEDTAGHFARGLSVYKLLLICFVGSLIGVVWETLFTLVYRGVLMNRAGLVYGPFNLLYGVGAVVLTAALYRFRNRGVWLSFLGSMIAGSAVEYVCSWAQELLIGSRSWDYSGQPFNLNGRICLVVSLGWGLMGAIWIKYLYPRLMKLILKIPQRPGKAAVWLLTVFFIVNAAVSAVTVYRWSQRVAGDPATGRVWEVVDRRFPDQRMEALFPSMKFQTER